MLRLLASASTCSFTRVQACTMHGRSATNTIVNVNTAISLIGKLLVESHILRFIL